MFYKKKKINNSTKNAVSASVEPPTLNLPFDNAVMKAYIEKNKIKLTEHVISTIESAVNNKLGVVEIFTFSNSNFVITVPQKEFLTNIDNIYNYYLNIEKYELCPRIVKLQNILKKS